MSELSSNAFFLFIAFVRGRILALAVASFFVFGGMAARCFFFRY
jgi:hypothetical protein